ncbi:MAG: glycosyltransferase, partial [bacterium]
MAGGTGGHVFPALALAEVLRERGKRVSWLGTRKGIEAELVPANDFPIDYIQIEGVRGTGILRLIKAPFLLLLAVMQSFRALRKVRPDVVVGLGGFASGPGGLAAWLLRKPLVIHEQNAVAGTTNKVLAKLAKRVMVAFPGALKGGIWCGNPVRREISALPTPDQRMSLQDRKPRLLVLG